MELHIPHDLMDLQPKNARKLFFQKIYITLNTITKTGVIGKLDIFFTLFFLPFAYFFIQNSF